MDRMYRNTVAVVSDQGAEIDPECLWYYYGKLPPKKGKKLTLADEDEHITINFDNNLFVEQ